MAWKKYQGKEGNRKKKLLFMCIWFKYNKKDRNTNLDSAHISIRQINHFTLEKTPSRSILLYYNTIFP